MVFSFLLSTKLKTVKLSINKKRPLVIVILCIVINYKINLFFRVSTAKNIGTLFMWLIATTPDDFKAENVNFQ